MKRLLELFFPILTRDRVIVAFLLSVLTSFMVPTIERPSAQGRLSIEATGRKNDAANAADIWLVQTQNAGLWSAILVAAHAAHLPGDGATHVTIPGSDRRPLVVAGRFFYDRPLLVLKSRYSGIVRIVANGTATEIDLFSPTDSIFAFDLRPHAAMLSASDWWRASLHSAGFMAIWFVVALLVLSRVVTQPSENGRRAANGSRWLILAFAAPLLVTSSAVLLAVWPASMTSDSLSQWGETYRGVYTPWHPPLYALTMRLGRIVVDSPASVAALQIALLAMAIGACLRESYRNGAPMWTVATAAVAIALYPAAPIIATTLWKDVMYTIAFLGLILVFLRILSAGSSILWHPAFMLIFVCSTTSLILFRHNGIAPALTAAITIGTLAWRDRIRRRQLLLLLSPFLLALLITRGIFPNVGVVHGDTRWLSGSPPYFALSGLLVRDGSLTSAEREILLSAWPETTIREAYDCQNYVPLMFHSNVDSIAGARHANDAWRAALHAAIRNPGPALAHLYCATRFYWQLNAPMNPHWQATAIGIDQSTPSLVPADFRLPAPFPTLRAAVNQLNVTTHRASWQWLFWRPALQELVILLVLSVLLFRIGFWAVMPITLTSLVAAVTTIAFATTPDYRYLLPIVIIAFILAPLSATPRQSNAGEQSAQP